MEQEQRVQAALKQTTRGVRNSQWDALWIAVPVVALLVAWRWRRRSEV